MTFFQVGLVASSWSASQTFAPEFSALIVIFGSVGPVISTRRSSRPGPGAGDPPLGVLADVRGVVAEARVAAVADLEAAAHAVGEPVVPAAREAVVQLGEERDRLRGEDLVVAVARCAPTISIDGVVRACGLGVGAWWAGSPCR